MQLSIKNVRLAFPQLFEAKTVNGEGEPAFSANLIFAQNHPAYQQIVDASEKVGKEKWGNDWPVIKKGIEAKDKGALHDGDSKAEYVGYEGNFYLSARNKVRPLVIDRDKTPLTAQDGKPYAGCYVNASIEVWAQDNSYGKRLNVSLRGVQFVGDGEAFSGGGVASDDEFDTEEAEDLV